MLLTRLPLKNVQEKPEKKEMLSAADYPLQEWTYRLIRGGNMSGEGSCSNAEGPVTS